MQNPSNHGLESMLAESLQRGREIAEYATAKSDVACTEMRVSRRSANKTDIATTIMRRGIAPAGSLIRPDYKPFDDDAKPSVIPDVKIVEMPDMDVASVRFIGPYKGIGKAVNLLCKWARPLGLMGPDSLVFGALYDMPVTTPQEDLRSDACVVLPPGIKAKPPVYIQHINCKGSYACQYFEFRDPREFPRHWAKCTRWIQSCGFQIDDRPMLEFYRGNMLVWDGTFKVDICIPVMPV